MYSIYTWAYIRCILLKLITVQKSTDILYWGLYTHFSMQVSRIWKKQYRLLQTDYKIKT